MSKRKQKSYKNSKLKIEDDEQPKRGDQDENRGMQKSEAKKEETVAQALED